MRCAVVVVLLVSGCGFRLTTGSTTDDGGAADAEGSGDDAPPDDAADAMIDAPPSVTCIQKWLAQTIAFDMPAAITSINSTSYDRDPFLSPNELSIWFSSGGATSQGGGDIYIAKRANRSAMFGAPQREPAFSTSGGAEGKMSMTENELFAVVSSTQSGGAGGADIWETRRPNTSANWGALTRTHVGAIDTANNEHDPFVSADGLRLYYAPDQPAPQRIVVAKRSNLQDPFGSVETVISSTGSDGDPMLFAGERVIVFYSTRTSPNGGANIWYATRTSSTAAFGAPIELTTLSSDLSEGDPHVSDDGCRIYFARNVGGGVDFELFSANAF